MRNRQTQFLASLALAMVLCACEDNEIRTYVVPKDPPRTTTLESSPPEPSDPLKRIKWTVPDGWRRQSESRPMRLVTFEAGEGEKRLEIAVSAFPDQGGGVANVNRWRGQVGLEPITADDLDDAVSPFQSEGISGVTLDMNGPGSAGEGPKRVVGAIMYDITEIAWFVKALDRPEVVDPHRDAIIRFARSFRLKDSAPPKTPAETSDAPAIAWERPEHWQDDPEPTMFAHASFVVEQDQELVKITVTPLVGDGGGALANINRWRGQVGLPEVATPVDQPTRPFEFDGVRGLMLDLIAPADSAQSGQRIMVALVARPEQTWFFKMTGPERLVGQQKSSFEQFLHSVRFDSDSM